MKLSCIFGHKWKGCTCERCGEVRNEGHEYTKFTPHNKECIGHCKCGRSFVFQHDYQTVPGKCYDVCSRCGAEAKYVPGHDAHHTFERVPGQCMEKCAICGRVRELEHQWQSVEGTDKEKCAVCGMVRPIPGLAAYRKDPNAFMDDCVEKLLAIFPTTWLDPEGHRRFDTAHRAEVRKIGEQLDKLGGMRAMQRVGMEFARRRPIHARKLETTWDGIGSWMG